MSVYDNQHYPLIELIDKASHEGASILIPDLQRPYVWKPEQVVLLVDSLVRGWPFGTLLLWKVHHNDLSNIPSRTFWRIVDRTSDNGGGETVGQQNPPGEFEMVLDGQQRLQSLLLAFGGDSWGFKLLDRTWREELSGKKPKGPQGVPHWSIGNLCLDLPGFLQHYLKSNTLYGVDYTAVLKWVVNDSATGRSNHKKPENYQAPLLSAFSPDQKGKFIRLSRLWDKAAPDPNLKEAQFRGLIAPVLDQYNVDPALKAGLLAPLGELLATFRDLKRSRVEFLELQPYNEDLLDRDTYNDSVVSIFTRLNTAGRTLTKEEITFAWLKTGWNTAATKGLSAVDCFRGFVEELASQEVALTSDEAVGALSFLWAICFNNGNLLSNKDLLRGETIRPMASNLSSAWNSITESFLSTAQAMHDRGLEYGTHYLSLNALTILSTWRYLADEWIGTSKLNVPLEVAAQKKADTILGLFADRWLLCSQWAETWAGSSGQIVADFAKNLSEDRKAIAVANDIDGVLVILQQRMEGWLKGFEASAIQYLNSLSVIRREQVREYFLPLWIWHRLDTERWVASQVTLRHQKRGKPKLEVDHIAPVKLLEDILAARVAGAALGAAATTKDDADNKNRLEINSIGNCFLLEKTFNISKGKQPLSVFLAQVYEFTQKTFDQASWILPLDIEDCQLKADVTDLDKLIKSIEIRESKVKADLISFVSGKKTRIDMA